MIIGTLTDGTKCVYDLPNNIKTAEEMQSLVYGYNNGRMAESQRPELYNQPKLLSLNGPMWNGYGTLKSTGETVAIIRYEKPCKYQPKRSTLERQPRTGRRGSDDGRPERENMKNWTMEQLYNLWRDRGYTKKEAQAKAEKDYKEMHRKKSETERHQIMQEMLYN